MSPKRIAFLVFPRLTMLDFIGAYDALRRVAAMSIDPEVTHRIIGTDAEIVDESGLKLTPDSVYEDLSKFDLLYVAGGLGTVTLMDNRRAVDYLKTWGTSGRWPRSAPARSCSAAPAILRTSARRPTTRRWSSCVRSAARW